MARQFFTAANTTKQALAVTTNKTILQIAAPANQRVAVQQITVSFDGTTNTNTPVQVMVYRQTSAGTTSSPTATIRKKDNDIATAVQTTVADGFTAEPSYGDQHWICFIHPQTGVIYPLPIPGEIILAGGGRLGVVCNAAQIVDCLCTIEGEE
jgi:non-ribosomal peptide synthetase component E (peptide arylation enzyme)